MNNIPSVGRSVHFYHRRGAEPLAAVIAKVWSPSCVNLTIFNEDGSPMQTPPTSINLFETLDKAASYPCCVWPYKVVVLEHVPNASNDVAEAAKQGFNS